MPKVYSFLQALSILIMMGMLSACSDDPETVIPNEPPSAEEVVTPCERSVLVYLLADNSLGRDGYDRQNLAEMIQAAADGRLGSNRLIIYHDDSKADSPMLKEVTAKGLKILKVYDNTLSSTSADRMNEAIADFKEVAPAERYGLVFWSHATGWPFANLPVEGGITPQWVGEDRGKYMDITDLHSVLRGKDFDYIYFDCCFMASVEALYEIREVADYFVASAAELPAEGMPYYEALPYLMAKDADLVAAARTTFAKYNALSGSSQTSTISVIKSEGLDALAEATKAVYAFHPIIASGYEGQPFERKKYNGEPCYIFDFEDYVNHLNVNGSQQEFQNAMGDFEEALHQTVEYHAATPWIFNSIKVEAHCGLTSYILRRPEDVQTKGYGSLAWYRDVAAELY